MAKKPDRVMRVFLSGLVCVLLLGLVTGCSVSRKYQCDTRKDSNITIEGDTAVLRRVYAKCAACFVSGEGEYAVKGSEVKITVKQNQRYIILTGIISQDMETITISGFTYTYASE